MKKTVLALTVLALSAWAQTTTPQPPIADLTAYLGLSDSQVQSLQSIQTQLRTSTRALMQQIAEKQQSLNTQLAAGSSSAATLGQLLLDIQALRKQVADAEAGVQAQALNVLTDAQKAKLQALVDASKLQPTIRQAEMIGLITPPAGAVQPMGPGFGGGRGMMGPNAVSNGRGAGAGRMGGMRPRGPMGPPR